MRTLRTVVAACWPRYCCLVWSALTTVSAGAGSLPKRIIDEVPPTTRQVTYNAFKLKGTVTEPAGSTASRCCPTPTRR